MSPQELSIWSMALGAVASVALARLADLAARPSVVDQQVDAAILLFDNYDRPINVRGLTNISRYA